MGAAGPDLASLNKLDLGNAALLANLMKPPNERFQPNNPLDDDSPVRPNDPVTVKDFVHALECIVRSSNNINELNPEQLEEIIAEIVSSNLLPSFSPQQLAVTFKNLAVICSYLPDTFAEALVRQAASKMTLFNIPQLSNVNWALMRIMPVGDAEEREQWGMNQQWIQQYHAAVEQQLEQVVEGQQPLPTSQQLANLLLVPTAVQQPFQGRCLQLFEQAMVLSERRMCAMAVAQTFTCYISLQLRPQQPLLDLLLHHLEEELLLYDYDTLTQVAVGVYALRLSLPNHLLADMTERADMLEASSQAEAGDVQLMKAVMDRLARAAVAAAS